MMLSVSPLSLTRPQMMPCIIIRKSDNTLHYRTLLVTVPCSGYRDIKLCSPHVGFLMVVIVRVVSQSVPEPGNRDFQSCAAGTNKNSGKHSQFLLNSVNSVKYPQNVQSSPLSLSIRATCQLSCMEAVVCCTQCDCGKLEMLKVFLS